MYDTSSYFGIHFLVDYVLSPFGNLQERSKIEVLFIGQRTAHNTSVLYQTINDNVHVNIKGNR